MPILQHHINEFKEIYWKQTGEELPDKEAWEMTIRLANLFRLLLQDKQDMFSQSDSDCIENQSFNKYNHGSS
jgi:hypothetical protein